MKHNAMHTLVARVTGWSLALAICVLLCGAGSAQAKEPQAGDRSPAGAQAVAQDGVVNINTATEEELVRLPGIGPSKAQAILALRKKMGKFERIESLLRVRGIGRKTLRKLAPMLTVKGQTTLQPKRSTKKGGGAKSAK